MNNRYLGVVIEPWELDSTRHDRIHDALYNFEEKCMVSEDPEKYGEGVFDLVETGELSSYFEESEADTMFVAGNYEMVVELFSSMDLSSEEVSFERYTVSGFVERPGRREILKDEVRSMLPFQERNTLVEDNAAYEALEEMGMRDAEVVQLSQVAQPPENSRYYSNPSM